MKKILLASIVSMSLFAENNQNLILDPYLSPYVGADDLIVAHQLIENIDLSKFKPHIFSRTDTWEKIGRFAELYFVWTPVNWTFTTTQHEVFGHGYRVRSMKGLDAAVVKYKVGVPPPYGPGGGFTAYRWFPSKTSVFQRVCVTSAGVESTAILANRVRLQWLKGQAISPKQTSLYLLSQHDITRYIMQTHAHKLSFGDMFEYTRFINRMYKNESLTIADLHKKVGINLLDPFTYYALYSNWRYIVHGTGSSIPMIPIGSYKYLPSCRLGLTPFGPEYYLENFLVKDENPIYFYLRRGSFAGHQYTGLGIEYPSLWQIGSVSLGVRGDFWLQPQVDFQDRRLYCDKLAQKQWNQLQLNHSKTGASISLICQKEMWSSGAFFLQIGGKTSGYLPGEELSSAAIFRIGLTLWY